MADERTRSLMLSKYYCTERALEVKAELARLDSEGTELKRELDGPADSARQKVIRRRRAYLKRRNDELKVERAALTAELHGALEALKALPPPASPAVAASAPMPKKKKRLGWPRGRSS